MADLTLIPRSGLEQLARPQRYGAAGEAGVTLALRNDLALASVVAQRHAAPDLEARAQAAFGCSLPERPQRTVAGRVAFVWAGPAQWLASEEGSDGTIFEARLRAELGELASISNQSDGRTIIRVSGPRARHALAKGVPLDLDPRAFRPGDAALTGVAHMGVHMWQLDAVPTYELAVFRSFAAAFWHWLTDSAAEFGVLVEQPAAVAR